MGLSRTTLYLKQKWKALAGAIEWRLRMRLGDDAFDGAIYRAGLRFRPFLTRAVFFGIAGSVGKTTAKDFLVGILGTYGRTIGNPLSRNAAPEIARTVLRTRPWHSYCVAELGESAPGLLDRHLAVLRPAIGVITNVGDDHLSAFGSREAIAREFAKVARAVPPNGTLILNHDDERVSHLRHEAVCRVITFGIGAGADLLASDVAAIWPEPLGFTVTFNEQTARVRTQLHGRQLLTSALAAIGGGLAAGLTLEECARGIAGVPPPEGRMQPVHCPDDITYIRDDFKAPAWTVRPLLDQLGEARASRKIFVLGTISDCRDTPTQIFKSARQALEVADISIFTGRFASAALKVSSPDNDSRLHAFSHIRDVATYLDSIRQPGDLIVLKGTNKKDHLSRLVLSQSQPVRCWVDDCGRDLFCSDCSHLRSDRGPPGVMAGEPTTQARSASAQADLPVIAPDHQVIVGLGNPGDEYAGTPHNIGYAALDQLCMAFGSAWQDFPEAWIAAGEFEEQIVWLIKVKSPMNLIGPTLKRMAQAMEFDASRCILVFDDIDLPLGKVRTRMNGSAGGHRGVASILEAFQSDRFRRVKIGVKSEEDYSNLTDRVLGQFSSHEKCLISNALTEATHQVHMIVRTSFNRGNA